MYNISGCLQAFLYLRITTTYCPHSNIIGVQAMANVGDLVEQRRQPKHGHIEKEGGKHGALWCPPAAQAYGVRFETLDVERCSGRPCTSCT